MPVLDKVTDHDPNRDLEREKDRDREGKDREKGPKAKPSTKSTLLPTRLLAPHLIRLFRPSAKDLSHVPCKFFKVGSCTAGVSCPFSHVSNEPGQSKGVCAWFVKGNCKFGHKCALAHILPGQSMSMDRKNKKAAQLAANANGQSKEGAKGAKSKSGSQTGAGSGASGGSSSTRNPLLSGSTAPTRILQGSARGPMPIPLKAAVSPSAPAPPVQDTDFASYGLPDESNKLPTAPAQNKSFTSPSNDGSPLPAIDDPPPDAHSEQETLAAPNASSSPLPLYSPSAPRQMRLPPNPTDLGPIGSPRSVSSHGQVARVNGFSPGTSPSQGAAVLSTSPFSAPGAQSVFFSYENKPNPSDDLKPRSGIAASLGAAHPWHSDLPPGGAQDDFGGEIVVEDDDLEELVPGSLSELLTPEEKSRRYSRTHPANVTTGTPWGAHPRPSAETHHHRYSRSVPAPSLLGDIKSIWSEGSQGVIVSPRKGGMDVGAPGGALPAVGSATPNSFRSASAFGGHSLADDHINSFLSPSNASAAFLPGNYQNYLNSRNGAPRAGLTTGVSGFRGQAPSSVNGSSNVNAANLLARINDPAPAPLAQRQPFDGTSESLGNQPFQLGRPIPAGGDVIRGNGEDGRNVLSPSARALQAHAPGQSLPQGLAAGYSRIHALPPPLGVASPVASSTFTPSQPNSFVPSTSFQANASERVQFSEWIGMSPGVHAPSNTHSHTVPGLESLASRPQYTNVTVGGRPPVGPGSVAASRNTSGKSWGTPLSPLSRPVVTGDDDDLFDMDR
jgi:Zinc finger C-x8-C-x5-C-x3-H type (and similar)